MIIESTPADIVSMAVAVLKGGRHHVLSHHWAAGMYQDAYICLYCSWVEGGRFCGRAHDADCPTHKAQVIIRGALHSIETETVTKAKKKKSK